ncbi:MAG TPA: hypothetical protein VFV95_00055 [Vicinamibacterales bacterium]|nr:hypothetical protein [Vicinamibacterales bacterium]
MEDDPRRERQGEDDPLDLFDSEGEYSEGESVFEEHDFEPLTASSPYEAIRHEAVHANALRVSAPQALHPSLAQGRASAQASPWMIISGAAAVVITLLSVPLLLSRGANDPSDLSSPSVEPDRSPPANVPVIPESRLPARTDEGQRAEGPSSADVRDEDATAQTARVRSTETAPEVSPPAARGVTNPAIDQRARDAAAIASRVPAVTPALIRPETGPTPSPASLTSPETLAASSPPVPPPVTSSPPASSTSSSSAPVAPSPAPNPAPTGASTLPSGPPPAAVAERPVLSSEVATAAPPTATPVSAVVPRDRLVQNAVNKYRDALNARDFSSFRAVYPSANVGALSAALQKDPQTMSFDASACRIEVKGATASASCGGELRYTPRVGDTREQKVPRRWEFKLIEKNDAWVIDRVDFR